MIAQQLARGLSVAERRLLGANVALAAAWALVHFGAPAAAQGVATLRARGDYTIVSGKTQGGNANAVYILDASNQELVALKWDTGRQSFVGIGYRDLDADARSQPGR